MKNFKLFTIFVFVVIVIGFNACHEETPIENPNNPPTENPQDYETGVIINGVKWAKRNVGTKNTFVPSI